MTIRTVLTSATGAALLSATCVFGAVGPARAALPSQPMTSATWTAAVERQIDQRMQDTGVNGRARVDLSFDEAGRFAGASIAKSSGSRVVDREALRVARTVDYPALPADVKTRKVTMALNYATSPVLGR